jgi:hypothetical protein
MDGAVYRHGWIRRGGRSVTSYNPGMGIPVESHLTAHGRRFGETFHAPDEDRTWRLIGDGTWRMIEDDGSWATPGASTAVDEPDAVTPEPDPAPVKPKPVD